MTTEKLQFQLTADDKASAVFARVRKEIGSVGKEADLLKGVFSSLGAALGVGFSVAGLVALTRSTVNGIDALNDLSDATGDSVENLSALEDIALRTGTSMDTATSALIKLNKALIEGSRDPDSEAARAIKNLGLSIKDLIALSPVERLQAVGKALNSFDGQNKLEYNIVLLGKSVAETAPLLKDLAEAGKLNATVTKEQAEQAEKFNKELFALQKNATDVSRTLAGPVVSAFNQTVEKLREGTKEAKGFWQTLLALNRTVAGEQLKALGLGGDEKTGGATGSWGDAEAPKKTLPVLGGDPKASAATAKKIATDRIKLAEFAAQQLVTLEEMTAQETAEAWSFVNKSVMEDEKERTDAAKLQWQQVFDFIDQEQQRAIEEGEAVMAASDAASAAAEAAAKDGKRAAEEIGLVFSSAAGDAIRNFKSLGEVIKGLGADLLQLALQQAVLNPLKDVVSGAFKGFSFAGLFADGGYIPPGQWGVVGERGPELAFGGRSGATIQSGGGGVTINQVVNVGGGASRNEVMAAMVVAKRSAVAEIYDAARRGRTMA